MKLLALDPSSTACGYAIFDGESLHDCGILKPDRVRDGAEARIDAICRELAELVTEHGITAAVIETTSGKVAKRHGGGGAGLAIYGWALGECRRLLIRLLGAGTVKSVTENEWTAGVSKARRAATVRMLYHGMQWDDDKGHDAADAVALGLWYIRRMAAAPAA